MFKFLMNIAVTKFDLYIYIYTIAALISKTRQILDVIGVVHLM